MHFDLKQLYFLSYCTSNNKIGSSIVLRRITTDQWAKMFLWSSRFNLDVISDVKILNLIFVLSYINNQRMPIADYFVILCEKYLGELTKTLGELSKIIGWVIQEFGWVDQFLFGWVGFGWVVLIPIRMYIQSICMSTLWPGHYNKSKTIR